MKTIKLLPLLFGLTFGLTFGITACDKAEDNTSQTMRSSLLPLCPEGDRECTYTMGWYKNHTDPGDWPIDPQTDLCGMTLLEILNTPPQGDHWFNLAHQWITATLNSWAGAPVDAQTLAALVEAEPVIMSCQVVNVAQATAWTETLDEFNNGELLAPHCDDLEEEEEEEL